MGLKVVSRGLISKWSKCPGCGKSIHFYFNEDGALGKSEGDISSCVIDGKEHLFCEDCYCVFEIPKLEDLKENNDGIN